MKPLGKRLFNIVTASLPASLLVLGCEAKKPPPAPPPPTVFVAPVVRRDLPLYIEAVGSLDGYDNADIRARVRGFLKTQEYRDGATVKAGQLLFTVEDTDYAATAKAARAALDRARIDRDRNRVQVERNDGLFKAGMISRQDVDNTTATYESSKAQIATAESQVQQAELNLSYTRIRTPIDGIAGLALVRVGNLVGQDGPTLLTTVSQVDPIRVNFAISEIDFVKYPDRFKHLENRDLASIQAELKKVDTSKDDSGDPGVELVLADGSVYPHRGVLTAANRQVDPSTGTIQVQALIGNPQSVLRPGQYGRVRIRRKEAGVNVLVVPDRALISVQGTFSLAVVGPDNKVALRRVDLGPSTNGFQVIEKGVSEGDMIVVDGVQKATDGALVDPRPVASEKGASSPAPGTPVPVGSTVKN